MQVWVTVICMDESPCTGSEVYALRRLCVLEFSSWVTFGKSNKVLLMQWEMVAGGNPSQWSTVYTLGRHTVCSAWRRSIIEPWEIYHPDLLLACLCMAAWMYFCCRCVCGSLFLRLFQCDFLLELLDGSGHLLGGSYIDLVSACMLVGFNQGSRFSLGKPH